MKNTKIFTKAILFSLTVLLFSCGNVLDDKGNVYNNAESATVKTGTLSVRVGKDAGRTIFVDAPDLESMSYTLYCANIAKLECMKILEYPSYADLKSVSIELEEGEWQIMLSANMNNEIFYLMTIESDVEIKAEQTTPVKFDFDSAIVSDKEPIERDENGAIIGENDWSEIWKGSVNVTLYFPVFEKVAFVKAALCDIETGFEVEGFEFETLEIKSVDESVEKDNGIDNSTGSASETKKYVVYSKTGVPIGTYFLKFKMYEANIGQHKEKTGAEIKPGYTEVIRINAGRVSTAIRELSEINKQYSIIYDFYSEECPAKWVTGENIKFSFNENETVTLPMENDIECEGYKFGGWYLDKDCTGNAVTGWQVGEKTSDVVLYAKWIKVFEAAEPNTYYVRASGYETEIVWGEGNDENLGTSPAEPFATLQAAIDKIIGVNDGETEYKISVMGTMKPTEVLDGRTISYKLADFSGLDSNSSLKVKIVGRENAVLDAEEKCSAIVAGNEKSYLIVNLTLEGLELKNGKTKGVGGGVCFGGAKDSSLTMKDCTISDNTSDENGGGLYVELNGGTAEIENCKFTSNKSASADGGAIYAKNSTLNVTGGEFSGNSAKRGGGAIYQDGGKLTVDGGTYTGNKVEGDEMFSFGGAIKINDSAMSTTAHKISNATFKGNTASLGGGAIDIQIGTVEMDGCTIGGTKSGDANTAPNGGAIYIGGGGYNNTENGTMKITGGQIIRNKAIDGNGGGIYVNARSSLEISGEETPAVEIRGNTATGEGNNLYVKFGGNYKGPEINNELLPSEGNIGITVIPFEFKDDIGQFTSVEVEYKADGANTIEFTTTEGDYSYTWYVDNVEDKDTITNTYTYDYSDVSGGVHSVTVCAVDNDGKFYSATCIVTVKK